MDKIKIVAINYYHYALPLARPFFIAGKPLLTREGVVVQLIADNGLMGFGDVAPLEGVSPESLKKAIHQLEKLKPELFGAEIPCFRSELLAWCLRRIPSDLIVSSVRFGLESAILSLAAAVNDQSLGEFLSSQPVCAVKTVGLLQGSWQEIQTQAAVMHARGQTNFKLKVGNRNVPLDVRKVEQLKDLIGPSARLRLDANSQWSLNDAVLFGRSIGKNQIEFVEEPCANPADWNEFFRRTDLPIAIDEHMPLMDEVALEASLGVSFLVVKPTVHGGVTGYLKMLAMARSLGREVVISSAFESVIGITILANLSQALSSSAGLGTGDWIQEDLCDPPMALSLGVIVASSMRLDQERLSGVLIKKGKVF